MIHRHLYPTAGYQPAAVEDILERGKAQDWVHLRDAIIAEPFGPVAETVLSVCQAAPMYGTSNLWTNFIEDERSRHNRLAAR
jgi:hypothetical protein